MLILSYTYSLFIFEPGPLLVVTAVTLCYLGSNLKSLLSLLTHVYGFKDFSPCITACIAVLAHSYCVPTQCFAFWYAVLVFNFHDIMLAWSHVLLLHHAVWPSFNMLIAHHDAPSFIMYVHRSLNVLSKYEINTQKSNDI